MVKFVNGKQGFCRREVGISLVVESKVQFRLGSGLTNRKGVFYPPARMDGVLRTTHPTFYMSGLE